MITAALLILFTLACLAMGAQRSWSNETQAERNTLVFQGRNQAYGAYPLRRDYGHRLLLAIIATFGLLAVAVAFAKLVAVDGPSGPPHPLDKGVDVDLEQTYVVPSGPPKPEQVGTVAPPVVRRTRSEDRPVEAVDSLLLAKVPPKDTALFTMAPGATGTTAAIGRGSTGTGDPKGTSNGNGSLTGIDSLWNGVEVQEMPSFPGGEAAMQAWMQDHLDVPSGVAGRDMVFVQFTVMRDGSLQQVQAVKGRNTALKQAAERAVRNMPRWIPGRMNGHAVRCRLTLPIRYETR